MKMSMQNADTAIHTYTHDPAAVRNWVKLIKHYRW